MKIAANKERIYFSTMENRGRYRHRDRNRSRNRYRKKCMIGRLSIDAGSAIMPKSIPIAIAIPMPIPIPIVPLQGKVALPGCGHRPRCDLRGEAFALPWNRGILENCIVAGREIL